MLDDLIDCLAKGEDELPITVEYILTTIGLIFPHEYSYTSRFAVVKPGLGDTGFQRLGW